MCAVLLAPRWLLFWLSEHPLSRPAGQWTFACALFCWHPPGLFLLGQHPLSWPAGQCTIACCTPSTATVAGQPLRVPDDPPALPLIGAPWPSDLGLRASGRYLGSAAWQAALQRGHAINTSATSEPGGWL